MEPSVVTKVVTDELSITTRFINGLKEFAMTRGIDFLEALIIFIIGYIICRYIRRAVAHILEKSDVDPSAKTFIEEIIFSSVWPSSYWSRWGRRASVQGLSRLLSAAWVWRSVLGSRIISAM